MFVLAVWYVQAPVKDDYFELFFVDTFQQWKHSRLMLRRLLQPSQCGIGFIFTFSSLFWLRYTLLPAQFLMAQRLLQAFDCPIKDVIGPWCKPVRSCPRIMLLYKWDDPHSRRPGNALILYVHQFRDRVEEYGRTSSALQVDSHPVISASKRLEHCLRLV